MKTSTTDQIEGKIHELKGDLKEKVGEVMGNEDLKAEGQDENFAGKVQKKIGEIKQVFDK